MSAEIVNLRRIRKDKARTEKEREAEANRVAFGRTNAEKLTTKAGREAAARKLDGHKRDTD